MNYRICLIALCLFTKYDLNASPFVRAGITAIGVGTTTTGLYLMAKDDSSVFRSLINSVKGIVLFVVGGGVVVAEPLVYAVVTKLLFKKQKEMPELFGGNDDTANGKENYSIDGASAVSAARE